MSLVLVAESFKRLHILHLPLVLGNQNEKNYALVVNQYQKTVEFSKDQCKKEIIN